jgi:hypothetical protein
VTVQTASAREPRRGGTFEDVDVSSHVTTVEETADKLLAHFRTTSLYFEIDPPTDVRLKTTTGG